MTSSAVSPLTYILLSSLFSFAPPEKHEARKYLQPFNDLIGSWKATVEEWSGTANRNQSWREKIEWSWRFRDEDIWLEFRVTSGKLHAGGELRAMSGGEYQLILRPVESKATPLVFVGKLSPNGRTLVLEREDDSKKETQRLTLQLVGEIRYVLRSERRPQGRTIFQREFQVAAQREGESLARQASSSKPECIVSGGLGTITVTYKGVAYYVCCTGCRDEFNANPEKYIQEWQEKKRKKSLP
jgi:hypothetical protein